MEYPIIALVVDATSGLYICNADVKATSGPTVIAFTSNGLPDAGVTDAGCSYFPATLGPYTSGSYTVSATAPGHQPGQVSNVDVQMEHDTCGDFPRTQRSVTVRLSPL